MEKITLLKLLFTVVCCFVAWFKVNGQNKFTNVLYGDSLYLKNLYTGDSMRYLMSQQVKLDYTNAVNTVADSATFYLTSDKTSTGSALYTAVNYVNPVINNVAGNYTFGWTISADKKTLVIKSRVATNTAVIALLGISVLGSTLPVTTGTTISVLVKGQ